MRQLGLPEIKLGIIPGAGGTQRLPRAIGVEQALQLITTGAFIDATKGAAAGLIDKLADGDVVAAAVAFAKEQVGKPPRRIGEKKIDKVPAGLFEKARGSHRPPSERPDRAEGRHRRRGGGDHHAAGGRQCRASAPCSARRPRAPTPARCSTRSSPSGRRRTCPASAPTPSCATSRPSASSAPAPWERASASPSSTPAIPLTIVETTQEALDKGVARVKDTLEANVKRGRATEAQAKERMGRLTPSLKLEDLGSADLIIEAVFENMALKKEIFAKLDKIAKPGAIIATNTSTLDVDEIAAVTKRPQDVVGLHFFSPANIMRLLEIVRAEKTAPDVMATSMAIAKKIGKVGVQAGVCDGFVGNRMLASYGGEVQAMNAGRRHAAGDRRRAGRLGHGDGTAGGQRSRRPRRRLPHPQGAQAHRRGGAVRAHGRQDRGDGPPRPEDGRGLLQVRRQPQAPGRSRDRGADPGRGRGAADQAALHSRPTRSSSAACCASPTRAPRSSQEGIALRASDIDTMYLNGYGFPAWRGGPMWQVDNVIGMKKAAERIKAYEAKYGARWKIAPLIEKLAAEDGTFAALDAKKK